MYRCMIRRECPYIAILLSKTRTRMYCIIYMFLRDTNPGDGRLMGHEIGLQEVTEYTGLWVLRVRSAGKGKKTWPNHSIRNVYDLNTSAYVCVYVWIDIYIYIDNDLCSQTRGWYSVAICFCVFFRLLIS